MTNQQLEEYIDRVSVETTRAGIENAATLCAIMSILIEKDIITEDEFLRERVRHLAIIDQGVEERRHEG